MSIKTKKRMPKCRCYPHPAIPNEPDFSVVEKHETNWKWADLFLKCNICGRVAKNAISHKYAEKRQFPIAPTGWDRGVHPDFKEQYAAWEYIQNQLLIETCDEMLENLHAQLKAITEGGADPETVRDEILARKPKSQQRSGWKQLPSGLIVPN